MRLIDADKLIMHLEDFALSMSGKTEYSTILQCIKAVEEQPTVGPQKELICSVTVDTDEIIERIKERGWEPVDHGRWIPLNDQIAKCSSCGAMESTFGKDKTGQALIHKAIKHYCPNCGAKMDEEADHDDHL